MSFVWILLCINLWLLVSNIWMGCDVELSVCDWVVICFLCCFGGRIVEWYFYFYVCVVCCLIVKVDFVVECFDMFMYVMDFEIFGFG